MSLSDKLVDLAERQIDRVRDSIENESGQELAEALKERGKRLGDLLARRLAGEDVSEDLAWVRSSVLSLEGVLAARVRSEWRQFLEDLGEVVRDVAKGLTS